MSMTTCVECGKGVSDQAKACPHCGVQLADGFLDNAKKQASMIAEKAQLSDKIDAVKRMSNSLAAKKEQLKEKVTQEKAIGNRDTLDDTNTNEGNSPAVSKEVIRYCAIAMSIVLLLSAVFGGIGSFVSATCLASGVGAILFGLRWYGTTLAVVYFVSVLEILVVLKLGPMAMDTLNAISLAALAGTTAVVYFFAKAGTYVLAWSIAAGIQALLFKTIGLSGGAVSLLVIATSTGLVWYGREHLKAIIMGSYGGALMFVGSAGIFLANPSNLTWASNHIGGLAFLNLAFMVAGIAFQYKYTMPKQIPVTP